MVEERAREQGRHGRERREPLVTATDPPLVDRC
jgi:hypothetical protein